MAEQVQRHRQYEYRANSNLVLTTEHTRGSRNDEPSGEPEVAQGPPAEHQVRRPRGVREAGRGRRRAEAEGGGGGGGEGRRDEADAEGRETVLGLNDDIDTYRPRSKETRAARTRSCSR